MLDFNHTGDTGVTQNLLTFPTSITEFHAFPIPYLKFILRKWFNTFPKQNAENKDASLDEVAQGYNILDREGAKTNIATATMFRIQF